MEAVVDGRPLAPALRDGGSADRRPQLSDSIRNFERLRHRARLRLIGVGLAQGMTVQDVSAEWGVSRQLAARYLRELEALEAGEPDPEDAGA